MRKARPFGNRRTRMRNQINAYNGDANIAAIAMIVMTIIVGPTDSAMECLSPRSRAARIRHFGAALRTHSADVAGQVVAARLAMPRTMPLRPPANIDDPHRNDRPCAHGKQETEFANQTQWHRKRNPNDHKQERNPIILRNKLHELDTPWAVQSNIPNDRHQRS